MCRWGRHTNGNGARHCRFHPIRCLTCSNNAKRNLRARLCCVLGSVAPAQLMPIRVYIAGDVTVTTSDSLTRTAVSVTTERAFRDDTPSAEQVFVFCVTHAEPIASKLNYRGGARVVYRTPRDGNSRANAASPEQILPALAVLQIDGESHFSCGGPVVSTSTKRADCGKGHYVQGRRRDPPGLSRP